MSTDTPLVPGLEHALLGLLRARPMHAYEMAQQLERAERLGLVWRVKQSHLYALLAKLEAAGYLASASETHGNRPPRKILSLTPRGAAAFARWLTSPVEHGRDFRLEFLAKLFFAAQEGSATIAALLAGQRRACHEWLDDLELRQRAANASQPFELLVLRFRQGQIAAILPWLDQCEQLLATEPPAAPATPGKPFKRSGRSPSIELLYFSGCPNYQRALTVLQAAVKAAKVHASIDLVAVETQEEAERQRFYGSPTIRVNGVDIVPPDPSAQPALACRIYRTAQGALTPIPPMEAITAALRLD